MSTEAQSVAVVSPEPTESTTEPTATSTAPETTTATTAATTATPDTTKAPFFSGDKKKRVRGDKMNQDSMMKLKDSIANNQTLETEGVSSLFIQRDISAELKVLRDLVNQQGMMLVELQKVNAAQSSELSSLRNEMENLKKENAGRLKVAFSAGIGPPDRIIGPFNVETNLIYSTVLTNIGGAYNSYTGAFTAPVRGVFYIRFTGSEYGNTSNNIGVNLYKNGQHLLHLGENASDGIAKHLATGVTLELEAGDVVYTRLPANYVLWGGSGFRTSFSGFLIFPM